MKRRLNITFHLQTDSQIERLNQLLEHYLQNYYNFEQDDWATKLFLTEFIYNTSWHLSTETTPTSALLRFDPKGPTDLPTPMKTGRTPTTEDRTKQLQDNKENVINLLRHNQIAYKKWYNQKKTPILFKINDWVLVSIKNLYQKRPSQKLFQ